MPTESIKSKERYNVDTTKTITHLSLCSGYEGIGLGLRSVLPNLREVAYVEREGFPVANLVAKMEEGKLDAAPVFTDVKTFPYGKFRGCVDILSGGFPCQPFSAAGKRQATEDPRHLFPYIADGIRECQPRIVFLENVQGILSCKTADGEPVLQYVLRTLEGLGYRATAGIFSAEEVGAPHQRKRVYILGMANSNNDGHRENSRGNGKAEGLPGEHRTEVCGGLPNRTGEELVNSNSDGHSKHSETQKEESIWGTEATTMPRSEELANSNSKGLEGVRQCNHSQGRKASHRQLRGGDQVWPSRPSEPQHEWEEPRVTGQAEPKLGPTSNGSSSRVDRLRLLGNGVVPQTAAKAFTTLSQRLI